MKIGISKVLFWIITAFGLLSRLCSAGSDFSEQTALLFVGEDEKVLSIASKREESAWKVPAVASVIERDEFMEKAYYTLDKALDASAGFHVLKTDSGTQVYLRGISNSALILYDTVPIGFSTEKSLNLIGEELPLYSVKRVEVVRGPGSVLWGPDALAGIVNVVPLTGRDFTGTETGVRYDSERSRTGAYLNIGKNEALWDGFLSLSGGRTENMEFSSDITRFFGDGSSLVAVEKRLGFNEEFGRNIDVTGNMNYNNLFTISGRFSEAVTPFSLSTDKVSWKEIRETRSEFLKIEGKKQFSIDSTLRFTVNFSSLEYNKDVIDYELDQEENSYYAETTYERTFNSGRSHLASGISYRKMDHFGIPVWADYLPVYLEDYVTDPEPAFMPNVKRYDYTTELWSLFGQYRMTMDGFEFLAGVRQDSHKTYQNKFSYNLGVVCTPSETWVVKGIGGTAYRTPQATQLADTDQPELEEIQSVNLQVIWKPRSGMEFSLGGFVNKIQNHVMEDPYAGLSTPNFQKISGLEAEASFTPVKALTISANCTLLRNSGPNESFKYIDYYLPGPDNVLVPVWGEIEYPYNTGPERQFNLDVLWSASKGVSLYGRLRYFSSYRLTYPYAKDYGASGDVWILDAGVTLRDLMVKNSELKISCFNLLDEAYRVPGTYRLEDGPPLSVGIFWRQKW